MNIIRKYVRLSRRDAVLVAVAILGVCALMLYKLGNLVGGLSAQEVLTSTTPVGWQGISTNAFDLPLKVVRSAVFYIFPDHGQMLTRLPNTLFGVMAIAAFFWLVRIWHGWRTALLTTFLFATSAWTLHVSRLASLDVLYLWATPMLLLANLGLHRRPQNPLVFFGSMLLWGCLLYIPGLVWLVALNIYWQWDDIRTGWRHFSRFWQRLLYVIAGLMWLPLLGMQLTHHGMLRMWVGLPEQFPALTHLGKQFGGVFEHLFIRGPQDPELWLGRAPLLDVFALVMCALGIYFYATHRHAFRSKLLAGFFAAGVLLVAAGGSVGLSVLVPLLYIVVAAGIAYLLHDWLKVFPLNPLARGVGLGLICLAVGLAGLYNTRAYFIAWPHNSETRTVFRDDR